MNWEKISNSIGVGFILVCFVFSLGRILGSKPATGNDNAQGRTTLRIAHSQLESGVREALDAIAKRYMENNPNVRVIQIPIPDRVFKNWRTTQLVGRTPPDLIVLGPGFSDDQVAKYLVPLDELANVPNPYNRGTPLEKTPLRETFFDGMESGFNPVLMEFYGIPATAGTFRIFYNMDLLKEITGDTRIPETYEEFMALCEQTKAFAKQSGRKIIPLGGSEFNASILMDFLFTTQTQRLLQERINPTGLLSSAFFSPTVAASFWKKQWTLESPEIHSGLSLVRNIASQFSPGFSQMQRDDGTFYFAQGNSLAIPSGTWDATSLQVLSPFPIRAGKLPLPGRDHSEFGKFAYGPISEAGNNGSFCMAIPKDGNVVLAKDFLLFMSSMEMNHLWSKVSKWPPAVVGVEPAPEARNLLPDEGGYPGGFGLNSLGADSQRLYKNYFYLLTGPGGSVEKFLKALESGFGSALGSDMRRAFRTTRNNLIRSDSAAASEAIRSDNQPDRLRRLDLIIQSRTTSEKRMEQISDALLLQN